MSEAQLVSVDPAIAEPTPTQLDAEYAEHTRTYNGFVHLAKWFLIHMALLLGGIYVATLGGSVVGGVAIIVIAFAALIYGIISTASTR
ncbi:aa3-type cytochrome c oxidase subunit IV [Pelagibacterium mangrovi]|uniref:aa3-type cytochrome c oxidase subunit IV n=1 Tax=Pelagibacterium mangrovi TaxID=3119828 RepID=UPI002FC925C6